MCIRATAADTGIAAALNLAAGAPCLVIERRTWSAERPVTHVHFTYPANAHARGGPLHAVRQLKRAVP